MIRSLRDGSRQRPESSRENVAVRPCHLVMEVASLTVGQCKKPVAGDCNGLSCA